MDELLPWLQDLTFWHWMVLGIILVIIELIVPGIWFLWLGLGALATGLVALFADQLSWQYQTAIFCVFSVASISIGRMVYKRAGPAEDHPKLNRRAETYVGRICALTEPTEHGMGRIKVGDSMWRVRLVPGGEELATGDSVKVTGVDGATLQVEPYAAD
ncbi:MAG: NfeD family protein [Alphaproteobacteria bacterium]|nr:NfeD family protein [Alphaproteobacteria bacterium]